MSSRPGDISDLHDPICCFSICLDGPDGWKVLRDIKRQHPHLPVIIFTAYDSYLDDPRLSQADGYVIKSIDLGELKQKVADVLKHKAAREESVHQHQWAEGNLSFWPGYLSQQPLPPEGHTLEHWE